MRWKDILVKIFNEILDTDVFAKEERKTAGKIKYVT